MRRVHDDKEVPVELIGSWTTVIGPNTDEVSEFWCANREITHSPTFGRQEQCVVATCWYVDCRLLWGMWKSGWLGEVKRMLAVSLDIKGCFHLIQPTCGSLTAMMDSQQQ